MSQIDKLNIRQQNSVHKLFLSLNLNNDIRNEHYINDREESDYCPNCQEKLSHGTCNICHAAEQSPEFDGAGFTEADRLSK